MINEDAPYEAMLLLAKAANQVCHSTKPTCTTCGYEILCNKIASTYRTLLGLLNDDEKEKIFETIERMHYFIV